MKKTMKRFSSLITAFALVGTMATAPAFADEISVGSIYTETEGQIAYMYSQDEMDRTVFTMDMFNEYYTREDVANMVMAEKATSVEPSNEYRSYSSYAVTEQEIEDFYANMEAIAARAPSLSYYFSNVYWQMRSVPTYGNTPTLTLVPTDIIHNDPDQNHRAAAWLLVKKTCGSSDKWTNEASISKQFDCHYMGEVLAYRGVIGPVGNWDIEPIRPAYGAFTYTVNKCNPV